jgi:acyl-CoA thioester hydrolase
MSGSHIQVRWRDSDALGHVNTVVFLTYLEEGRDRWLRDVLGDSFAPNQYVVVRVEIDYRCEIAASTQWVSTDHDVVSVGSSSVTFNERLHDAAGSLFAEAQTVLVLWDPVARKPRPVSDTERAALQGHAFAS